MLQLDTSTIASDPIPVLVVDPNAPKKILTIIRSEWYRGQGADGSYLFSHRGMCCLGFDAKAHGLTNAEIDAVPYPICLLYHGICTSTIPSVRQYYQDRVLNCSTLDSEIISAAMHVNDDEVIDPTRRETEIRILLQCLGWDDVVFVD